VANPSFCRRELVGSGSNLQEFVLSTSIGNVSAQQTVVRVGYGTVASGMTPPDGSVMTPRIDVVDCGVTAKSPQEDAEQAHENVSHNHLLLRTGEKDLIGHH